MGDSRLPETDNRPIDSADSEAPARPRRSLVRTLAAAAPVDRRRFLQAAAGGVGIGAGGLLSTAALARTAVPGPGELAVQAPGASRIVREFDDPYLELLRLLREASEIEHALMLQYLYAAFSVRPKYRALRGEGNPNSTDLLGIAVQEMKHLGSVNRMLVALGAAPNLMPQDFPYEPDIYPFEFTLEPLSRHSLAKYIYTEAPVNAFADFRPPQIGMEIEKALGRSVRPNHVGSLYDSVLKALSDLQAESRKQPLPRDFDFTYWKGALAKIKNEGEADHFGFFRNVFAGNHVAFGTRTNLWSLAMSDPDYPAMTLPHNPSAFLGDPNQIPDARALQLAWLGNVHYWTMLTLLTHGYRFESSAFIQLAEQHMQGPILSLAIALAQRGAGMPFEQMSMGYAPALDEQQSVYFILRLLGEAKTLEADLKGGLPTDYPVSVTAASADELAQLWAATQKVQSYRRRD